MAKPLLPHPSLLLQLAYADDVDQDSVLSFPLAAARKMYLSLWNDEDYLAEDPQWRPHALDPPEVCCPCAFSMSR